jgi:metal-responsive CopG/Arc/MetJ family transcriptional regulator
LYEIVVFCHNRGMSRAIKTSRRRSSRVFTISFPDPLAKQVIAVAKDENRNISELFREAFRAYLMERNERKLIAARAEAAKQGPIPYTEDDVEALVHEVRREFARKKQIA